MSKKIGFIGLGIMGAPMAANLVKAGFEVTGYNRSPGRIEQFVAAGGCGATDIAGAVREADLVATMVPDSPDVREVLAGEGGVFENAQAGTLIIDFSSIRPDVAAALAAEGAERGFRVLDAPVSGGEAGAVEGVLSIMVGGAAADFEAAKPVFDAVGKTVVHVGHPAQGGRDAGPRLQARLPDRTARQGHGHRHRRRPRGRRGDPARRRRRAAGRVAEGAGRRRA